LVEARPAVLWLDDPHRPPALPPLSGGTSADLAVVGGGYTGLWTALRAKERDPSLDVVVVEAGRCGDQASGRHGWFASASLTHGFGNGLERWPDDLATLDRLGAENLAAIGDTVRRYGIACRWEETGELAVATAQHQVEELGELVTAMRAAGHDVRMLDGPATRALVRSRSHLGARHAARGTAMVEPARLAWGLREACLSLGVRIFEGTSVTSVTRGVGGVVLTAPSGSVRARQAVLATNAFPPLLRRLSLMTVPVYDYVLATEPLTSAQLAS